MYLSHPFTVLEKLIQPKSGHGDGSSTDFVSRAEAVLHLCSLSLA